jgi:hypothetical protein
MALLLADNAATLNNTTFLQKQGAVSGDLTNITSWNMAANAKCYSSVGALAKYNRYGSYILNTASAYFQRNISNTTTIYMNFSIRLADSGMNTYINFFDTLSSTQCTIYFYSTFDSTYPQCVRVTKGSKTGTQIALVPYSLAFETWTNVSVKVTFSSSAGTVDIRINDNSILSATGLNNISTSHAYTNIVRFGIEGTTTNCLVTDFLLYDSTGSNNNTWISSENVSMRTLMANADGTTNDFTPSSGSRYQCVSEQAADDDATYVSSNTPNNIQLFGITDVASGSISSINAIQVIANSRRTDLGTRTVALMARTNSTNYTSPTLSLAPEYVQLKNIWAVNPNTSSAWTESDINALEAGITILS